jgi:hypothetical protein
MTRLLQALAGLLLSLPAWAIEEPRRAAESPVALVMYATVAVVLVVGFLYVWWRSRKERQREERRRSARRQ